MIPDLRVIHTRLRLRRVAPTNPIPSHRVDTAPVSTGLANGSTAAP